MYMNIVNCKKKTKRRRKKTIVIKQNVTVLQNTNQKVKTNMAIIVRTSKRNRVKIYIFFIDVKPNF